ncbi:AAA family ATPase [Clavibacter michiganensis]|uniref:AAA family ATPase n=1 Tax=Clavibacter michiganensis TaxID=28447 RepID=UPI0022A91F55|nr:AAA family ATPase [Clavibacter michiganensis]
MFERTAVTHTGPLDAGQRDLAREFATSDRELVVGIGPAGAGKTTALRLAATALEDGGRRMIGLAPSAPAASVIAEAVGIEATTIHGFLTAHAQAELPHEVRDPRRRRPGRRRGRHGRHPAPRRPAHHRPRVRRARATHRRRPPAVCR